MSVNKMSGIQKEVIALYRALLREALKKDRSLVSVTAAARPEGCNNNNNNKSLTNILFTAKSTKKYKDRSSLNQNIAAAAASIFTATSHVRNEFRRQALQVNRKEFKKIEHKIRHGYKQIKLLRIPSVKNFRSW